MKLKRITFFITLFMLGINITPISAKNNIYQENDNYKKENIVVVTDSNPMIKANTRATDWKWTTVYTSAGSFELKAQFYVDSSDNWRVYKIAVDGGLQGATISNVTSTPKVGARMTGPTCIVSAKITFEGKSFTISGEIDRRW